MGMQLTVKHPLLKRKLNVSQDDSNPTTWQLECPGHTAITFDAEGAEDAIGKAQSLCGNLRLTDEEKAKREENAAKKKLERESNPKTAKAKPKKGEHNDQK